MEEYTITQQKEAMRAELQRRIVQLPTAYTEKATYEIGRQLEKISAYQRAKVIFCFVGTKTELNTRMLIQRMWEQKKRVAVPKCTQKGRMEAREITALTELEIGRYGILEPKEVCKLISQEQIDFGVIPCLSCNEKGWRLGYGGGYYDRYLENTKFCTAVVCRERLVVEKIPIGVHDQQMDFMVTEDRCIPCRKESGLRVTKGTVQ